MVCSCRWFFSLILVSLLFVVLLDAVCYLLFEEVECDECCDDAKCCHKPVHDISCLDDICVEAVRGCREEYRVDEHGT